MNIKWCIDAFPEDSITKQNTDSEISKNINYILNLPVTVEKIGDSCEIINITGLEQHKMEHSNRQSTLNQLQSELLCLKTSPKMEKKLVKLLKFQMLDLMTTIIDNGISCTNQQNLKTFFVRSVD